MRKLVKKLALVLALVMAIGCIAPASAQAAQVAEKWTWNFDEAGLVKPTKNMLVGETYKFEVLMYGEKLDAEEYSVKYYAKVEGKDGKNVDCDSVIMNTKTGLLYAAEAAKDIKIAAVVKNSKGGTAKVWAFLDVYAASELEIVASPSVSLDEALEIDATFTVDSYVALADGDAYDLDVTATIADEKVLTSEDGINFTAVGAGETEIVFTAEGIAPTTLNVVVAAPVVVTPEATPSPTPTAEAALAAVSVAQPSFDTFVVTYNKDLGSVADAKALVSAKIAQKNSTIKYTTLIKSASVNGKELTVVLYNAPANDQNLYFTFNGVEAPAYKVAVGKPASIVVNTVNVVKDKWADVSITVKDANGTLLYNGAVAKAGAYYTIEKVDVLNADAFLNSEANQVWYLAEGKTVEFIVKYVNGNDKVDSGKVAITSAQSLEETTPYMQFAAGAPGLNTEATIKKLTFADGISIRLGEPRAIYAKRVKTVSDGIAAAKDVAEYSVLVDAADDSIVYTYEIIDSAIALVMGNGTIIPVKQGTTEILIKSVNAKNEVTVVACCPVTVTEATAAKSTSFTLDKTSVSNAAGANDKIVATIEVLNNYGEKMTITSAEVVLKKGSTTKYTFNTIVSNSKVEITGKGLAKDSYTVEVKANGVKAGQTGVITVVQPDTTKTKTYTLSTSAASLAVDPEKTNQKITITANRFYAGIIDGVEAITGVSSDANEVGKVYYTIKGVGSAKAEELDVTLVDGAIVVSAFKKDTTNTIAKGQYTVELLEKREYNNGAFSQIVTVAATTFEIKDGKAAFTVVTDSTRINSDKEFAVAVSGDAIAADGSYVVADNAYAAEILSNMKLYIGQVKDANKVTVANLSSYKVTGYSDGASTVVITKVEVTRNNVKYTYDLAGDKMVIITYK